MIENFQKMRNSLIKKIRNFDSFADEKWVAGLYRELRGTWLILWDVHARFVPRCSYSYVVVQNHPVSYCAL